MKTSEPRLSSQAEAIDCASKPALLPCLQAPKIPAGKPFGPTHFEEARFPIRSYYFTDDTISTRANVPPMLALYEAAEVETRWVEPSEVGVKEAGHLGFFRFTIGQPLWAEALEWLEGQARGD